MGNSIVQLDQKSSAEADRSLAVHLNGFHSDGARAAEALDGVVAVNGRTGDVGGR